MPKSLVGQMALLLGIALLIAQLANFALILNERQKLSLARSEEPAITRFVNLASDFQRTQPRFRAALLEENSRRRARFALAGESIEVPTMPRQPAIEARLAKALSAEGIEVKAVQAHKGLGLWQARAGGYVELHFITLSARLKDGKWLNGRMVMPRPDPFLTLRLAAATLLLYLIVLGATVLIAIRIARPIRDLARAAERFGGRGEPVRVEPRGSADLRRAVDAFNAMNRRVVALLDEKDRMLGAIGHDLRTPLASLRIRVESMEPESERERMVGTIEEMNVMLEDVLVLARTGRAREESRRMDVTALLDALLEEYRDMGAAVTLTSSSREVASVRPNLLRRAVRNLVDNGLKYGGSAQVGIRREQDMLLIEVRDQGPGIAPDQLGKVLEPFSRIEESRSRETGGSGLGLAITRAVAENHGGTLRLENATGGGLIATLTIRDGAQAD